MIKGRTKPGWSFWLIVALIGLPLLYAASFGPACWVVSRTSQSSGAWEAVDFMYSPILRAWWHNDSRMTGKLIGSYANLGARDGLTVARTLEGSFSVIPIEL